MNRKQVCVVILGPGLVALSLAFPHWVARHVDKEMFIDGRMTKLDWELERSWIGSPPERIAPEDINIIWETDVSLEERKKVRAQQAAKYAPPTIDWKSQVRWAGGILGFTICISMWLGRKRETERPTVLPDLKWGS